jgi:1-acyl-sn-glycerol-3-phosphate acyltransferase
VIEEVVKQADAVTQFLGALGGDIGGALRRDGDGAARDWFEVRDPEYIRRTLPGMRLISRAYYRCTVRGLANIPAEGPVLLVGNHSGGTLIADTFVFAQAFYAHFGPMREFHQLAHDLVFKIPGARAILSRWGTVPASPGNMKRALDRGSALLVYPGGDQETYRPSWQSARIDFAGRKGFARLALEHDVPIVPVTSIGGQETALFLGRGRRLARALQLHRFARVTVLPPVLGPPMGATIFDLPLRFPLPAQITVSVGRPIDLRGELGAQAKPEDAYDLVTSRMQRTLTRLGNERTVPVLG